MIDADTAWAFIEPNEGCVNHLYQDDKGFVTFGCGNLAIPARLDTYDWRLDDGTKATPAQIMIDYQAVADAAHGYNAGWFKSLTRCRLSLASIRDLFAERVQEFTKDLVTLYPFYNEWPREGQLAELDMIFNLGIGALSTFTHHVAALKKRPPDWQGAADNCHRKNKDPNVPKWDTSDKHERRQIRVRDLFLSCKTVPPR